MIQLAFTLAIAVGAAGAPCGPFLHHRLEHTQAWPPPARDGDASEGLVLEGTVVAADGVTPASGAIVQLRPPGSPIEYRNPPLPGFPPPRMPAVIASPDGRFAFEVPRGDYAVHVLQNAWIQTRVDPVSVAPDGSNVPVTVRLPETVRLEGQLTGGEHANVQGLEVRVFPETLEPFGFLLTDGFGCSGLVRADGTFTVEHVPFDSVTLSLRDPATTRPENCWVAPRVLARPRLEQGIERLSFELGASWPASLELRFEGLEGLSIDGAPPGSTRFFARVTSESDTCGYRVELDADGAVSLRGLPPEAYRVALTARRARWDVELGPPICLSPGEERELRFDMRPRARQVRVVDHETGVALGDIPVRLRVAAMPERSGVHRTDDEGCVELDLPPGTYTVAQPSEEHFGDLSRGQLIWTVAGQGELVLAMKAY